MANKVKKVSVNQIDKIIPVDEDFEIVISDTDDVVITVRPRLDLSDSLEFVRSVVSSVVDEDLGITYCLKDFSTKIHTLQYYTNITIPQNLDKQQKLAYSEILNTIFHDPRFKYDEYQSLLRSIDKQIEFEANKMQNEVRAEVRKLVEVFNGFGKAFDGVKPEEITSLIDNFSKIQKIDEKAMVEAYMKVKGDENADIQDGDGS